MTFDGFDQNVKSQRSWKLVIFSECLYRKKNRISNKLQQILTLKTDIIILIVSFFLECPEGDQVCANDQLGFEAIRQLHSSIDDDHDGNLDRSESDDVSSTY